MLTWLATVFLQGNSKEVSCEYSKNHGFSMMNGSRACFMDTNTRISSIGVTIVQQEDQKTKSLIFQGNKKIYFLPENIYENFPELVELDAKECAIRAVSRDNFRNLQTMKKLNLQNNEIEKIPKNSFEDLVSLEVLDLSKNSDKIVNNLIHFPPRNQGNNKIKFMNGQTFNGLTSLNKVGLNFNKCIKQDFEQSQMKILHKTLKSSCGFCELNKPVEIKVCEISAQVQRIAGKNFKEIVDGQKRQLKMLENLRSTLSNEVPAKMTQSARLVRLEAELLSCNDAKDQAEKQFSLIKEFADRLDAQRVQSCYEKTQEMRKTISMKNQEREKLLHELKEKTSELAKSREMLEHLEGELANNVGSDV